MDEKRSLKSAGLALYLRPELHPDLDEQVVDKRTQFAEMQAIHKTSRGDHEVRQVDKTFPDRKRADDRPVIRLENRNIDYHADNAKQRFRLAKISTPTKQDPKGGIRIRSGSVFHAERWGARIKRTDTIGYTTPVLAMDLIEQLIKRDAVGHPLWKPAEKLQCRQVNVDFARHHIDIDDTDPELLE